MSRPPKLAPEAAWRTTPAAMMSKLSGGALEPAAHIRLISAMLVLVSLGFIRRLAVSLPPGHAKTQTISRAWPTWQLDLWPKTRVILTSYAQGLAEENGKAVREEIEAHPEMLRVRIKEGFGQAAAWQTHAGGGMWTAGLGGGITGRRGGILVVDDPFKDYAEAHSASSRESVWNWYLAVGRTRLLPGAPTVAVHTRWHEEDLIGRFEQRAAEGGEQWVFLRLPAIAEEDETLETVIGGDVVRRLQRLGAPLPKWSRKAGEPLWPVRWDLATNQYVEWYTLEDLLETQVTLGPYLWAGLYQQRPAPPTGTYFPIDKWEYVDAPPLGTLDLLRSWDLAATEGGGDWTVGALMGRDKTDGRYYVIDVVRRQVGPAGVEKLLRQTADYDAMRYGRGRVLQRVEQEGGSSGKAWAQRIQLEVMEGHPVKPEGSSGDKTTRALPYSASQQNGLVFLCRVEDVPGQYSAAPWWPAFIEEHRVFDNGAHDDQVDAASLGFNELAERARLRRKRRAKVTRARGALPA